MARARSGRSASRKSTPVSPPKERNVELPANNPSSKVIQRGQVGNLNGTRTRCTSVGSESSAFSGTRGKTRAYPIRSLQLQPVFEASDVGVLAEVLPEGTADEDSDGASAITPLYQREKMIFGLKSLWANSEGLLGFLTSRDFSDPLVGQSFRQPDSKLSREMERLLWMLSNSCELFGEREDVIPIALKPAVQKLVGSRYWQEVGPRQWRPDAIFQSANLASFAAALLGPKAQSSQVCGVLHTMWEQFPSPFTYGFEPSDGLLNPGFSKLLNSTFEVGLEIRTQFAIGRLSERRSDLGFDPNVVLEEVFYVNDDEHSTRLLGFNAEGLCVYERFLPESFKPQVLQRIQAMQRYFPNHNDGSVDYRSLESSYPWRDFVCQVMSWVKSRAAGLRQQIVDQGGVNSIQDSLRQEAGRQRILETNIVHEAQRSAPMSSMNQVASPRHEAPGSKSISNGRLVTAKPARRPIAESARLLVKLEAELIPKTGNNDAAGDGRAPPECVFEHFPPLSPDLGEVPIASMDDLRPIPYAARRDVSKVIGNLQGQSKQSNKENTDPKPRAKTFIDRQHDAQRVNFDDDSQEVVHATRRGNGTSGKRPHSGSQQENDDADDFGATTTDDAYQRRKQLRKKTGSRGSFRLSSEESTVQLSQPSSSRPSSEVPPMGAAWWVEELRLAQNRKPVATREPRRPQIRTRYTEAEVERLIDLIGRYGTSYSFIKKMDERDPPGALLLERNQVQLKDKAQELKLSCLKSGLPLPPNFDKIPLRTRSKQALEERGIDYQGY